MYRLRGAPQLPLLRCFSNAVIFSFFVGIFYYTAAMSAVGTQSAEQLDKIRGEPPKGDKLRVVNDANGGAVSARGEGTLSHF